MRTQALLKIRASAAACLLQRKDRRRFKGVWALVPMQRIMQLPPYSADFRRRAAGQSEWFEPADHSVAVRMLTQMPTSERADLRGRLTPLPVKAPLTADLSTDTGPQEIWWALEDLWSRVAMCCSVIVEAQGDTYQVVLVNFRHARSGDADELRHHVLDTETYTWRTEGEWGEFVRLIEQRGDDLVCTLTSLRRIEAWPDGLELIWQVKAFLLRLWRPVAGERMASSVSAHGSVA